MRGWWGEISSLVLPTACAGCGQARTLLCAACRGVLCAGPAYRVRPGPVGLPVVCATVRYADQPRAVLLAHKERGALPLAVPLGESLAMSVRATVAARPAGPLHLVPVPSARSAVARRGHDAVRRIALAAAARLRRDGLAARVLPVLRLRRTVLDQAGLTAQQRLANVSGALTAGASVSTLAGAVILVDDVLTTGASLAEAARAVMAAGGRPRGAAVVAGPAE